MRHHILVVSIAVAITNLARGKVGEVGVANAGAAEMEHADGGHASIHQVQGGQGSHGRTQAMAGNDDSIARELLLERLDGTDDTADNALLSDVKALVHLTARALGVAGQNGIQVVRPVGDGGRSTVGDKNRASGGKIADIALNIKTEAAPTKKNKHNEPKFNY